MNFQNVRLRPLLCAVLSVILVTGSMILPAFAAEQNVNFPTLIAFPLPPLPLPSGRLPGAVNPSPEALRKWS